jgi:hypothetical protein
MKLVKKEMVAGFGANVSYAKRIEKIEKFILNIT